MMTTPGRTRWLVRTASVTLAAAAALYAASGTYVVGPGERGVLTRFGRLVAEDVEPGLHYHAPWPFERVACPGVSVVETASAVETGGDGRRASRRRIELLTGDRCLMETGVAVEYDVTGPGDFLLAAEDAALLVRRAAESALAGAVARATIDDVLGPGVDRVQRDAADQVQAVLDACGAGIRIKAVRLDGPGPAGLAAGAQARALAAADSRRQAVSDANGYRARMTELARGEAGALAGGAEAYRRRATSTAEGEAARFAALLEEYRRAPDVVRDRLYLETMQTVFGRVRKHVVTAGTQEDSAGAAGGAGD
jgi:membrane protease subunit HflK